MAVASTAHHACEVEAASYSILGPLEVTVAGARVDRVRPKERVLLAMLAAAAGEVMSPDRIAEAVWPGNTPQAVSKAVQNLVLRARKVLGGDAIETRDGGYRLSSPREAIDAHQFEDLVARARAEASIGELAAAAASYEAALGLWRGAALPELEDSPFASVHRSRLEALRRSAWEEAAEAGLALDDHRSWVTTLESMVEDEPLRERRWELLILALYRCGRQAEAMRAYQRARGALAEAGLEPADALRSIEQAVSRQDPSLTTSTIRHDSAFPTGVVTYLVTDVEDSISLWDQQPSAMADALDLYESLVDATVSAHDGHLIKSRGEDDATLSVFHRASDAIDAAIALQVALEACEWPDGLHLRTRMALHSGESPVRRREHQGTTVNQAVRIRRLAAGGQIFLSRVTHDLVADVVPGGISLVPLGEVKGLRRAETVYSVSAPGIVEGDATLVAARVAPTRPPVPALLATAASAPLGGRAHELQLLTTGFADLASRASRTVLISGEPGIGKTRLVAEAAAIAHSEGAIVLLGRCDDAVAAPFQPFAEAFGAAFERAVADAGSDQYQLFTRVSDRVNELASSHPVLLVLDDLHWATKPTHLLLRHLVRSTAGAAVMILATHRNIDIDPVLAETLADLRRIDSVDRIALDGLDELGIASMLERFGHPDGTNTVMALARVLVEHTSGNPFFLNEVLRDLDESGAIARSTDGWRWSADSAVIGLPLGVREVLEQRLARLGEAAHQVLRCGAIVGREMRLDVVMAAAECDEDTVLDALDAAAAARLVSELGPDRFRFSHALVQTTLIDSVGASRRARLHRRVAKHLERAHPDDVSGIAHHWLASATAGEPRRIVDAVFAAARRADESGAIDDAADLLGELLALDLGGRVDAETQREIALRHAIASHRAGRERGWRLLGDVAWSAHAVGDADRLGRAVAARTREGFGSGTQDNDDQRALQMAALEALGTEPSESRARILATLGSDLVAYDVGDARRLIMEAEAIARQLPEIPALQDILLPAGSAIRWTDIDWQTPDLNGTLAPDRWSRFSTHLMRLGGAIKRGDMEGWEEALALMKERADGVVSVSVSVTNRWNVMVMEACLASVTGRLADAKALNQRQREYGIEVGRPDVGGFFFILDVPIARDEGRVAGIADMVLGVRPTMKPNRASWLRAQIASCLVDEGRHDDARELVAVEASTGMSHARDNTTPSTSYAYGLAEAVAALDDRGLAELLLEIMAPWSGQMFFDAVQCYGPIDRSLGRLATVLGRFDDADRHLRAAEDQCSRLRAPLYRARTWADQARLVMLRDGDVEAAKSLVERAAAVADELAAPGVERYARSVLDAR